eukprot:gene15708-7002_t
MSMASFTGILPRLRCNGLQVVLTPKLLLNNHAKLGPECRRVFAIGVVAGTSWCQSRFCSSDLKNRGLRSLEKFIDTREAENLDAEIFEKKRVSLWREPKPSFFQIENDIPELPAETQLQTRNRNPRNMELLGYNKPKGYGKLRKRRDFWNRLNLVISNNHTTAYVDHHTGEILVSASTQEFAIARHLSKNTDVTAAVNVGRVIAERCKECGIDRVFWRMNHVKRKEKLWMGKTRYKEVGMIISYMQLQIASSW